MSNPILKIQAATESNQSSALVLQHCDEQKITQAILDFPPLLSPEDEESIRWYLEEYRKFPFEPATTIAHRTAKRLKSLGEELFDRLFYATQEARELWNRVDERIESTRIEIESRFNFPWEILRNPLDAMPLSCRTSSFVRYTIGAQPRERSPETHIIRVLLVISRPAGFLDAPFRSVAARILERVGDDSRFQFEVLRPPTFSALWQKLAEAANKGQPYTILHFDGHGVHEDRMAVLENRAAKRRRGYLLFEHPSVPDQPEYKTGPAIAEALAVGRVPILILNACRSARAESWNEQVGGRLPLGSLADEVLRIGQPAVLAMQYNIDVTTAAQFVADLYQGLADQLSLSEAVAEARRGLYKANRVANGSSVIDDWLVPVLFENAAGYSLSQSQIAPLPSDRSVVVRDAAALSRTIGTDDTLMALERAFQHVPVVILRGQVGSGLRTVAAEFDTWLARTSEDHEESTFIEMDGGGGLDPFLALYPKTHGTTEHVEDASTTVASWLAQGKGLCVLNDLGIGSAPESEALNRLLAIVSAAGRRILVLTRVPDLPLAVPNSKVNVRPLEYSDRVLIARTSLPDNSRFDPEAWRPILAFSQGNPAVLNQLITKFVRSGLDDPVAVIEWARVEPVGLDAALLTSLRNRFDDEELECLALATLFDGPISAKILAMLASVNSSFGARRETLAPVFEKLAAMGLVTPLGRDYYQMHPGLPGLLRPEFERRYPNAKAKKIRQAQVTLFSTLAVVFYRHGESGELDSYEVTKQTLALLEPTMWRVLDEGKKTEQWSDVRNLTAALQRLLPQEGRHHDWQRLAEDLRVLVTDQSTDQALPGRESVWYLLLVDRIERLIKIHSLAEAAWLQERLLADVREEFAQLKASEADEYAKEVLIDQLIRMADIHKERGDASAAGYYLEALRVAQQVGVDQREQRIASWLAILYLSAETRDLKEVSYWLNYASELCGRHDRIGLAWLKIIEGDFALAQLEAAVESQASREEYLRTAYNSFLVALTDLFPAEPSDERALCERKIAQVIYERWRNLPETMQRLQSAIGWYDADQNVYKASYTRLEASRFLSQAGEKTRAYFYAMQAARGFASLAPHAETEALEAHKAAEALAVIERTEEE